MKKFDETTSSVKTSCWTLVFWLLVVSSFNYFKMYAWSVYKHAYLLHSAFMFSVVKMLLKGEVGGCAFNSHGNNIVDHGILFLNFCGNPKTTLILELFLKSGS